PLENLTPIIGSPGNVCPQPHWYSKYSMTPDFRKNLLFAVSSEIRRTLTRSPIRKGAPFMSFRTKRGLAPIVSFILRIPLKSSAAVEMVRERNGRFVLRGRLPEGVDIVEYAAPDEPLFPKRYSLDEYRTVSARVKQASGYLNVLIDEAARERAEEAHR